MKKRNMVVYIVFVTVVFFSCTKSKSIFGVYSDGSGGSKRNYHYQIEIFPDSTILYSVLVYVKKGDSNYLQSFNCDFFSLTKKHQNKYSLSRIPFDIDNIPVSVNCSGKESLYRECLICFHDLNKNYQWMLVNADTIYTISTEKYYYVKRVDRNQTFRIIGVSRCQCDTRNDTIASAPFFLSDDECRYDIRMDKFHPYMAFYNPNDTIFTKEIKNLFVSNLHKVPYIEIGRYLLKKNNIRAISIDSIFMMH